ncbi:diguanylate cyclase [Marinospirillum sp.]|uniref:sensor domain-containing diguanylate cyclase n=1 Tax=Marinospirillum sp. TaxID=2183934 RepID=UPI003A86C369
MPVQATPTFLLRALEQATNPIVVTDAQLDDQGPRILYVNQAFTLMTGYSAQELQGQRASKLQGQLTNTEELEQLKQALQAGRSYSGSNVNYRKDGSPYLVEWNISPVRDEQGEVTHFISVQRDVSQRRQEEHFSLTLLNNIGEGVFGIDSQGCFTFINPSALRMLGYASEEEVLGRNSHELTHHTHPDGSPYPEENCPIYRALSCGEPLKDWDEDWFWRQDGSGFPVEIYAAPMWQELGQAFGGVVTFWDISERKALEQELQELAFHDQLTHLYNRRAFIDLLEAEVAKSSRYQTRFSLIMFDLDHFKRVNDSYGHDRGDQVLKRVAELSQERLRANDSVARWGGEEFMVLLPETSLKRALKAAESLRQKIADENFTEVGQVTISLGVAEYQPEESLDSLTQRVDQALYAAKEGGRNQVVAAKTID